MPINMPGGKLLAGLDSYINIISPYNGNMSRLNVSRMEPREKVNTGPGKAHSGTGGYPVERVTGYRAEISLHIWWEADNPPRDALNFAGGWGCGLQVAISTMPVWAMYGFSQQSFFILLSGMLTVFNTNINAEGAEGEDGIVTADAIVKPNGTRLFLLPDELTAYRIEVARLQALGQLNALATFETLQ